MILNNNQQQKFEKQIKCLAKYQKHLLKMGIANRKVKTYQSYFNFNLK